MTFLFSDIEGATHLASTLKSDYSDLLKAHRAILRDAYSKHHGWEIRAEGDSFFVVFASAKDALAGAVVTRKYPLHRVSRSRERKTVDTWGAKKIDLHRGVLAGRGAMNRGQAHGLRSDLLSLLDEATPVPSR